jgi:hypothetical protein
MDLASLARGEISMDPNGLPFSRSIAEGICKDCTVLAGKMDAVFPHGIRGGC